MAVELEVFGYCLTCAENSAFPDVVRRLVNGRCGTCGSDVVAGAHTVAPTSWGAILDSRFLRGERFRKAAS